MNNEEITLMEEMIKEVAGLNSGSIAEVDAIWDRNYDRLIEMTVDENCGSSSTCDEESIHDEMADLRVMFYNKAEEHSYECISCGKAIYGKRREDCLCNVCRD